MKSYKIDLDAIVLLSLFFQFMLAIASPWRKFNFKFAVIMIWAGYLLESGVVYYAMGLIPDNDFQGGRTGDLRVFWAPYLILHLGGPRNITGLSLADNELWVRFAARLISLSYTFGRVFLHSFNKNDLWLATALVFFAALIRYIEKVICRFLARLTKFHESIMPDPDPGANYAKLSNTHCSFKEAGVPAEFRKCRPPSTAPGHEIQLPGTSKITVSQVQIVKEAYRYFHEFRGLFVDSVFSFEKRDESRRFFLRLEPEDAFEICEVELNFAYDVFYTKSILLDKPVLRWLTLVSLFIQLVSTWLWARIDKTSFHRSSVHVTNALVYGTISIDLFSICMLSTSDWAIAWVNNHKVIFLFKKLLLLKKCACRLQRILWRACSGSCFSHLTLLRIFFRWSESVPQLNLIAICADKRSMESIGNISRNMVQSVIVVLFTAELRDIIFRELVVRSTHAQHPEEVDELCSSRGLWVLALSSQKHQSLNLAEILKPWITDVDYEESLIIWNIATTICYYTIEDEDVHHHRECSKILADYMLNLLIRPFYSRFMPTSAAILGHKIFIDTCADARRFLNRKLAPHSNRVRKKKLYKQACEKILQVNTDVIPPRRMRGHQSKSVLFDGCLLAKELQKLNNVADIKMWELISNVWAEMLFYSAAQSRGSLHLVMLCQGGELLTLVWLLMSHLGLGKNQFRYTKDESAELIVGEHASTLPSFT